MKGKKETDPLIYNDNADQGTTNLELLEHF